MENKNMSILIPVFKSNLTINSKIFPSSEYVLYFDGCSKGNPGNSGIGAVLYKGNEEIWAACKYIGDNRTNNEAEYEALIMGLEQAICLSIYNLIVCGDSLLVINQIIGKYRVKNSKLIPMYEKIMLLKTKFKYIEFNHVYRVNNKRADELSNLALNVMNNDVNNINLFNDIEDDLSQNNIINNLLDKNKVNTPPRIVLPQISSKYNRNNKLY
jgi:ribonuclease HI